MNLLYRPELPPFLLDFGCVVYGCVEYRSVTLTNVSYPLISFTMARASLNNTGFSVDIGERVKNLPGAPDCESIDFNVKLDPASVRCPLGKVEARLPFNVSTINCVRMLVYFTTTHAACWGACLLAQSISDSDSSRAYHVC